MRDPRHANHLPYSSPATTLCATHAANTPPTTHAPLHTHTWPHRVGLLSRQVPQEPQPGLRHARHSHVSIQRGPSPGHLRHQWHLYYAHHTG
ncbi:MAG: hypothetical protein ACK53Y_20290, partial [bacterium]